MPVFTLGSIIAATGSTYSARDEIVFSGISIDTRTLQPGDLFIPLKGDQFDGHDFVALAAAKGAAGAIISHSVPSISDRFPLIPVDDTLKALAQLARHHRSLFSIPILAITGSVGKTTTKEMIAHIARSERAVLSAPENWNNEVGVPLTLLDLNQHHDLAVFEFAMRGEGQIKELAECARPTIGVITNIGESHVELLGSIEAVADAKAELFECLRNDAVAIANRDDPFFERLRGKAPCSVVTFGTHKDSNLRATCCVHGNGISSFVVTNEDESKEIELPLPGMHNVLNALAAIAACCCAGISLGTAAKALRTIQAVPHRSRIVRLPSGITVLDDCYNASPASVRAALQVLRDWNTNGKKIFVFGDMKELGARSPEAHRQVGAEAAEAGVQLLLSVGELAALAAKEADRTASGTVETICCEKADDALDLLRDRAMPEDFILVKASRAMKLERLIEELK